MDIFNNSDYDTLKVNEKCEDKMDSFITCERTLHQKAKISLPISIEPFVVSGKIKARCCGDTEVSIDCKDNCSYVITQDICIEIPLKYGVSVEINEEYTECKEPNIEGTCND